MVSFKTIITSLLGLYSTIFIVFSVSKQEIQNQRELHNLLSEADEQELFIKEEPFIENETVCEENSYRFSNPILAYKILKQLNVLDLSNEDSGYIANKTRKIPYIHLKKDDNYCDKHTMYITEFPETIFQDLHFITDYKPLALMRKKVIPSMGNDIQPHIGLHMSKNITRVFDIKPEVGFFLAREELFYEKRIGQHFSCLTQISSHFPSKQVLDRKNQLVEAVNDYAKRYDDRPQCFNSGKFFPKTYLLYKQEECKDFFKIFNSPEYQALKAERRIVYIKKLGANVHMGEGVDPVNEKQERELRKMYSNGTKCGQVTNRIFVQEFIHNPLLLNGHKFDFRMYLLFASTNPLIAYYHDGFLRVSLNEYDINSDDKKTLLTNLALSHDVYDDAKNGKLFNGMNEEELKDAQQWSFDRFQSYLLEKGVITDPNWLNNYLRPQFKKALVHLMRFTLKSNYEHSSLFQLYGMDFMLDEDLNLWFIEANSKPGKDGYSRTIEKFMIKMFQDQNEIVIGLLRSRTKRIISYVNKLIADGAVEETKQGEVVIKDLEHRRMVFEKLSQNWFEKEFEPKPDNGFSKILDENYTGVNRYQGLIDKECL